MTNHWLKSKKERLHAFFITCLFMPALDAVKQLEEYLEVNFPNNENKVSYENGKLLILTKNEKEEICFEVERT